MASRIDRPAEKDLPAPAPELIDEQGGVRAIAHEVALGGPPAESGPPDTRAEMGRRRVRVGLVCGAFLAATGSAVLWTLHDRVELQETSFAVQIEEETVRSGADLARARRDFEDDLVQLRGELTLMERDSVTGRDLDARAERIEAHVDRTVKELERNMLERVPLEIDKHVGTDPDLHATRVAVRRMEARQTAAERLIGRYSNSVCFIQGAYAFGRKDKETGKFSYLRQVSREMLEELGPTGDKVPLTMEGDGELFQVEYTGTGFLADRKGFVLTNRHIAEPWWKNDSAKPLIQDGFEPRFLFLRAYFPEQKEAVVFHERRTLVSDKGDVALLVFTPKGPLPEPVVLCPDKNPAGVGSRVVLLGYPSGMNALLAKAEEEFARELVDNEELAAAEILDALARNNAVRPLPSHGHVGDVLADKLLYDAPTAVGGSGGPVFNLDGQVIAINYGILKAFQGANFGVPIALAAELLDQAQKR